MTMTGRAEFDAIADALERGIPLIPEPFAAIARRLGMPESTVLGVAREMMSSGLMRRFGAFFDYHRLGYRGYLFGVKPADAGEPDVIGRVCGMPSVTHAYGRRHELSFWFTALFRDDSGARDLCSLLRKFGCAFVALETVATIKLRPSFASCAEGSEIPPDNCRSVPCVFDERMSRVTCALQDGVELTSRPFDEVSQISGMDSSDFLSVASRLSDVGILRRVGASFDHYRAGWTSNSLCAACFPGLPEEPVAEAAMRVSRPGWASHCYLRKLYDCNIYGVWPYNLYVMIHADSDETLRRREDFLRRELRDFSFVSLRTTAEYKKTSFKMEWGASIC